jgi:hypothetical protein
MAYDYDIPLATDQISVSQNDILQNFTALGVIAGNGQSGSAALAPAGTAGLNFVYLPPQASIPPIVFPAGNVGLYSATNTGVALNQQNELYINRQVYNPVSTANVTLQVLATASILGQNYTTNGAGIAGLAGWSYIPSGLLIKWGVNTWTGSQVFTMDTTDARGNAIPAFSNACMMVYLTIFSLGSVNDVNQAIALNAFTPTTITAYGSNRTTTGPTAVKAFWLAIGY